MNQPQHCRAAALCLFALTLTPLGVACDGAGPTSSAQAKPPHRSSGKKASTAHAKPTDDRSRDKPNKGEGGASSSKQSKESLPTFPVTGDISTTVRDFSLKDPQGRVVLRVGHLEAALDLDALKDARIHMPSGAAKDLKLALHKGKSGRVSLSEAFHQGPPPAPAKARESSKSGMLMDIGPLDAERIELRIEMGKMPVVIDIAHSKLSVERKKAGQAPRVMLSELHGTMRSPNPLPRDISIYGGGGVIDLEGEPLVDLRVRVCLANAELRMHIRVPHRDPETTYLVVEGDRFMGVASAGVLDLVGVFKKAIEVDHGEVNVAGKSCDALDK